MTYFEKTKTLVSVRVYKGTIFSCHIKVYKTYSEEEFNKAEDDLNKLNTDLRKNDPLYDDSLFVQLVENELIYI